MDKEKVMELVRDAANSAYDEAYFHEGMEQTDELIKDIENELNSKPVMPKVFDEWFSFQDDSKGPISTILWEDYMIYQLIHTIDNPLTQTENNLCNWIVEKNDNVIYPGRLELCVEAIVHDYEVEK